MNPKRIIQAYLLFVSLCPSIPASAGDENPAGQEITTEMLLEDLPRELRNIMNSESKLEPLPPVIENVYVSPRHQPHFSINWQETKSLQDLVNRSTQKIIDHDDFRLMVGRRLIGWGTPGEVFISSAGSGGTVLGKNEPRHLFLPFKEHFRQAAFSEGWIFLTSTGLQEEGGESIPFENDLKKTSPVLISGKQALAVILPNSRPFSGNEDRFPLTIILGQSGNWDRRVYRNLPFGDIKGVVRQRDGEIIAVGRRIARLRHDFHEKPSGSEINAVLEAVRASNSEELRALLWNLTLYPSETLHEVENELMRLPDPMQPYISVELNLDRIIHDIRRMKFEVSRQYNEGIDTRIRKMMDRLEDETRKTLETCYAIAGPDHDLSPLSLARLFKDGFQYFDGWWITSIELLLQPELSGAYLKLRFRKNGFMPDEWGIFHLNDEGRLLPLFIFDRHENAGNMVVSAAEDHEGRIVFLFRGQGLGRYDGKQFEWVDQSDPMMTMDRLIGCDASCRLYFLQHLRFMPGNCYWVYNEKNDYRKRLKTNTYPVIKSSLGQTVVQDDRGRIWFIAPGMSFQDPRTGMIEGSRDVLELLSRAQQKPIARLEDAIPSRKQKSYPGQYPSLYCIEQDKIFHLFSDPSLATASLIPGKYGSMFAITRNSAHLILEDSIHSAIDLHELAIKHFGLLIEVAQERNLFPSAPHTLNRPPYASCLVLDDTLWVLQEGKLEAYRRGAPLSVQEMIGAFAVPGRSSLLIGPLRRNQLKYMVLVPDYRKPGSMIWFSLEGKEIKSRLVDSAEPVRTAGGGEVIFGSFTTMQGVPIIDHKNGLLYFYQGYGRLWEITGPGTFRLHQGAARPVFLTRNGRLLLKKESGVYNGYRLMSADSVSDLTVTFLNHLAPVHEEEDGTFLCLSPCGVAWIRQESDGNFQLGEELRTNMPHRILGYVGQTDSTVYVLSDNGHLVAIPRK